MLMMVTLMSASALDRARHYQDELTAFRRDIHAHPELGLENFALRTASLVGCLNGESRFIAPSVVLEWSACYNQETDRLLSA
jgi:hypothetical protein